MAGIGIMGMEKFLQCRLQMVTSKQEIAGYSETGKAAVIKYHMTRV